MPVEPAACVVTTPTAVITGERYAGHEVFAAIPFAEFPDGPLREASALPRRLAPGEQPRKVDARQVTGEAGFLQITRPAGASFGQDLPVVVYIHGGGYDSGSYQDSRAAGGPLADRGVIMVSIGYRTGLTGFVHFFDEEPTQYRGISDCQLGLEWVQRNIEAFGGDPTNVTLTGQSAGAGIALWLMRKDHFRGAFRRVVAMSPSFPRRGFDKRKGALRRALGTPITRRHLERLLARQPQRAARSYRRYRLFHPTDLGLGPYPFEGQKLVDVPLLVTCTRNEFYRAAVPQRLDAWGLGALAARLLSRRMGVTVPASGYVAALRRTDPDRVASQLAGDSLVRRFASQAAEEHSGPTWLLEFVGSAQQPASHCDDLPFFFGTADLSQVIIDEFVAFARGATPAWPSYQRGIQRVARTFSLIDASVNTSDDPLKEVRLAFQERTTWSSWGGV